MSIISNPVFKSKVYPKKDLKKLSIFFMIIECCVYVKLVFDTSFECVIRTVGICDLLFHPDKAIRVFIKFSQNHSQTAEV